MSMCIKLNGGMRKRERKRKWKKKKKKIEDNIIALTRLNEQATLSKRSRSFSTARCTCAQQRSSLLQAIFIFYSFSILFLLYHVFHLVLFLSMNVFASFINLLFFFYVFYCLFCRGRLYAPDGRGFITIQEEAGEIIRCELR